MFNGYMYNVVNPLYGEDIGTAQIKRMYPTTVDPIEKKLLLKQF